MKKNKLTMKQAKFAKFMALNGGKKGEAARMAGYAYDSTDVAAQRLCTLPKVLEAIEKEEQKVIKVYGPAAVQKIYELMNGAVSENVQLEAAKILALKMNDYERDKTTEIKHTVEHKLSREEMIAGIISFADEHKLRMKDVDGEIISEDDKPESLPVLENENTPAPVEQVPEWLRSGG